MRFFLGKKPYLCKMNTKAKISLSGKHIIGMDYSLPVLEYGEVSELLRVPERIQYSGSQSITAVEDVPNFYFREQAGLVVPFYMDGVAACKEGVVREEEESPNMGNIHVMSEITIYIVVENEVLCSSEEIKVDVGNGRMLTEQGALATKLVGIFALNMVDASVYFTKREEVDGLQDRGLLRLNDFVVTFLDGNLDIGALGVTCTGEYGTNSHKLTKYSRDRYHEHPESSCFVFIRLIHELSRPNGENRTYKIENDNAYFDKVALTTAHELYHSIIWRSLKYDYLKGGYIFGTEIGDGTNLFQHIKDIEADYFDEDGAHNYLDMKDLGKRRKQYSLNTRGDNVGFAPFMISPYMYKQGSFGDYQTSINMEMLVDIFFLNNIIDLNVCLEENPILKEQLPQEITKSVINKDGKPFTQGISRSLIYQFRTDKLQKKYVEPFLKQFIPKQK